MKLHVKTDKRKKPYLDLAGNIFWALFGRRLQVSTVLPGCSMLKMHHRGRALSRQRRRADTVCKVKAFREHGRTQVLRKRDTMGGWLGHPATQYLSRLFSLMSLCQLKKNGTFFDILLDTQWFFAGISAWLREKDDRSCGQGQAFMEGTRSEPILVTILWQFWARTRCTRWPRLFVAVFTRLWADKH